MSDRITIRGHDHGMVWLFAVDLDPAGLKAFGAQNGSWPLKQALGADTLDPEHVELFDLDDLAGLGLSQYLEDGQGVPPDQLADMQAQIEGLTGAVLVLTSRAFAGVAQELRVKAPLRLVATFTEDRPPVSFDELPSESAKGEVMTKTKAPPSNAAISGRVAMVVLLVMFALVGLMIWIAA